jgi:hypothetical protein
VHNAGQSWLYLQKRKADNRDRSRHCRERKRALILSSQATKEADDIKTLDEVPSLEPCSFSDSVRLSQRLSAQISRKIALYTAQHLKGLDVHVQNDEILKFLGHSLVKDAIPPLLSDLRIVK